MAGKCTLKHPQEVQFLREECGRIGQYRERIRMIRTERQTLLWKMSGCRTPSCDGIRESSIRETDYIRLIDERERLRKEQDELEKRIRWVKNCLDRVTDVSVRLCIWKIYGEGMPVYAAARQAGISAQSLYRRMRREMDGIFETEDRRDGTSGTDGLWTQPVRHL